MRPIRAKKPLPQVGQRWVDALLLVLIALDLRAAVPAQLGGSALLCSVGSFDDRIAPGGSFRV